MLIFFIGFIAGGVVLFGALWVYCWCLNECFKGSDQQFEA